MNVEENPVTALLNQIHCPDSKSERPLQNTLPPRGYKSEEALARPGRVLQQGTNVRIAANHLVHNHNIRTWKTSRRPVSLLKLRAVSKTTLLRQLGCRFDHF